MIAVGGAGGNIAAELQSLGALDGLGFAVQWIHVDTGHWNCRSGWWRGKSSMVNLTLAPKGTGGNADLGRALAREHRYLLKPLLAKMDIVILVAGLGGGSGGGMTPYVAQLARDEGALTVAIVTMPFSFESIRGERAGVALKRLKRKTTLVFTFSNQQLAKAMGNDALLGTIYEVQSKRIAWLLRDLLRRWRCC